MFFRLLAEVDSYSEQEIKAILEKTSYQSEEVLKIQLDEWLEWFSELKEHVQKEGINQKKRIIKMNLVNPKYVLRNYMAQLAIEAADEGDYSVLNELFDLLKNPYDEQSERKKWFATRPEWALEKVGCSMLSCSS